MDWKVNKLILTNSENGRNIVLGDIVEVSAVAYKTVAVYDDDVDPTIRSKAVVGAITNGSIVRRIENLPTDETINGLIVGFRFLQPSRVVRWNNDGRGNEKIARTSEPRKPYLLVCFWPTHKPILVDPDFAFAADALEFRVDWRKQLPPHPDKEFWKSVMNAQEN